MRTTKLVGMHRFVVEGGPEGVAVVRAAVEGYQQQCNRSERIGRHEA